MKSRLAPLLVSATLLAGPAWASNTLYLTSNDATANIAHASFTGTGNELTLMQTYDGTGAANDLEVDITGDLNGAPLGAVFGALPASTGLLPGQLIQRGDGNVARITVNGTGNLFSASQLGANNTLTAMVIGNNNQSAISQAGSGNDVSFSQNGNGNVLTVIQRSY